MYVYIYIYTYIHIYVYDYIYIYTPIHIYIYTYILCIVLYYNLYVAAAHAGVELLQQHAEEVLLPAGEAIITIRRIRRKIIVTRR